MVHRPFKKTDELEMKKTELAIGGMHCASCSVLISRALQRTPGVLKANVNYASGKALVEFDEKQVSAPKLVEVVQSKGYSASIGADLNSEKMVREKEISRLKVLLLVGAVFSLPALLIGMFFMDVP